jgi:hypothetical protein
MNYRLNDEEIQLLKELKGAGDRGRIFAQVPLVVVRLARAGYVKRRLIKASAVRYLITELGVEALENAMA